MDGAPGMFLGGVGFLGYNFDDNGTETGFLFIPPDPCGAAGTDRVMSVVNVGIECRTKAGALIFRDALKDFFSPLGAQTLGTWTFDPKIVWDHYEGRFVVVALEQTNLASGGAADASRILVAVSKTATPGTATAADWWYLAIDSKVNIGGIDHWADYPGFEVDEEAVYVTNNMYSFASGSYGGVRLWIIDKGVVGGFYSGGIASWNIHYPIPAGFFDLTTQPALVFGAGGVAPNVGTFLVGYSGLTDGIFEYVQVIRVDNPLGATTFTGQLINVGDIETLAGNLPDAPQSGSAILIETNDRRALDAVWRNNSLWMTTTIDPNPTYDPVNTGQATAHWFQLDTSALASILVMDQGNIGGEDIATEAHTFFPAVAANVLGDVKFGFAASASTIYCGAYFALREAGDPPSTVQASGVVQVGLDWYWRQFSGTRNRWGDYTGAAVDPVDDTTFWVFNEYAEIRGTPTSGQDGRWGTAWRQCIKVQDFGDAPDPPYQTVLATNGARHAIVPNVFMGAFIDPELDGQPHPNALGDDLVGVPDDEDGVTFPLPLIPGQPTQVDVIVSVTGWLDIWFDFNQNGSWLDPGEQVFSNFVAAGLNPIFFNVPAGALAGPTYARFRFNLVGPLPPYGPAPDGEVEDYEVAIEEEQQELDYGDAPDQPYPTLIASNGASHIVDPNGFMGALIDAEPDGQPDATATGDDLANLPDEDGVNFVTPFVPGQPAQVDVIVTQNGWLDIWFDFNKNGNWFDAIDLVYSGNVVAGINPINFIVPAAAVPGLTFARFRYNLAGAALPPDGPGPEGEVEDYEVFIDEPIEIDFGDAPDPPYPTLIASNGAQHVIVPGMYLGASVDGEPNGQPDPTATGDDLAGAIPDDEDGVVFTSTLDPTKIASVDVTASVPGLLDAWIDFDNNGVWDPSDQIFASQPLAPGLNSLNFAVPATGAGAQAFLTFARFRFSSVGGLPPDGASPDGEVEDYQVRIEDDLVTDAGGQRMPTSYALYDPVPNPFNPQTRITFALPTAGHVKLTVYDVRGRVVATLLDEGRGPGVHDVVWDGRDDSRRQVASGVYLYRLEAGTFRETKRMVLVK